MRQWFVVFILLLAVATLISAPIEQATITHMSRGLNTVASDRNTLEGEARAAHNVNLDEIDDAIKKRQGYDSLFRLYGIDSFLHNGIFTYKQQDGTRFLILASDSAGVDYGNIYASLANTVDFNSIDTTLIPSNWTGLLEACREYEVGTLHQIIEVVVPPGKWGLDLDTCLIDVLVDSTSTVIATVDEFVTDINNSTCASYITASRVGNDLIIAEDSTGHLIGLSTYNSEMWDAPITYGGVTTPGNRIATRFPTQFAPRFTTYDNKLYITSSVGKGVVWDGRRAHSFPLRAPGELGVAPLSTSGNLKGRYRYAIKLAAPEDSVTGPNDHDTVRANEFSYLTTPVIVNDAKVLLYDFPKMTRDSMHPYLDVDDSATYELWRTTGDVGPLDLLDSIWNTGQTLHIGEGDWLTATITDTLGDDSLRGMTGAEGRVLADDKFYPIFLVDTAGGQFKEFSKPGAPGWVKATHANLSGDTGIWQGGARDWTSVAGWSWIIVPVDTIGKDVGDTGRSFNMYQTQAPDAYALGCANCTAADSVALGFIRDSTEHVTLALPEYSGDGNVLYWVYRGPIVAAKYDTTYFQEWNYIIDRWVKGVNRVHHIGEDFFVDGYRLLGTYAPGDTIVDSLPYDSLLNRADFRRNAAPQILEQLIAFDNRLIGSDGSYVYVSDASDSGVIFDAFQKWPINRDDGDAITVLMPQKEVVKIGKNQSVYNFFKTSNIPQVWREYELAGNYGCVAPLSHEATPEGDIFLSEDGVRIEREGAYKSRSVIPNLISKQLAAFRDMDILTKRGAISAYYDRKYFLSFPSLDTTWVMFLIDPPGREPHYAWATSSIVFAGATMYRAAFDLRVTLGDTLYFIKPGNPGVFRYETSPSDGDQSITWLWLSAGLNQEDGQLREVEDVVLDVESSDTSAANPIKFIMYDEGDSAVGAIYNLDEPDTSRYFSYKIAPMSSSRKWSILLWGNTVIPYGMDPTQMQNDVTIHGIRTNLVPRGFPVFK